MANVFQTAAGMANVTREAWSSTDVAEQFYNENPLLAKFRAVTGTVMGGSVQVPIYEYLPGGYASTDAVGGSIQDASPASTTKATYTLVYHWFQSALETGALNQTATNAQALVSGKNIEMEGAISAVARQCSRQLASSGTGFIAALTAATSGTAVLTLAATDTDVLERGWLYPGLKIDIGLAATSSSKQADTLITDVDEVAGTVTVGTGTPVQTTSDFISIANPNSTTLTNPELNGLPNMIGTGTLGGINPTTAGKKYWKSYVDTSTTVLSLDLILNLRRKVRMKVGDSGADSLITSLKQEQALYLLLQNQVRYGSDNGISAGNSSAVSWAGMNILALQDIRDAHLFVTTMGDFVRATGDIKEPTWVSDIEGAGGDLRWAQGKTNFVNALVFPFNVGMQRRNGSSAATALT